MAFEADCDGSTVLEALRMATTVGPVWVRLSRRSPKGEAGWTAFRIPNSEFRIRFVPDLN